MFSARLSQYKIYYYYYARRSVRLDRVDERSAEDSLFHCKEGPRLKYLARRAATLTLRRRDEEELPTPILKSVNVGMIS